MKDRIKSLLKWADIGSQNIPYGAFVECGVFRGKSINAIASAFPEKTLYGYDSFIGLPEKWDKGSETYEKGHFDLGGKLPKVRDNVVLVPGFFNETLPSYDKGAIAFLHIDCDLYSSTYEVLSILNEYLIPGTVIALDEYEPISERAKARYTTWEDNQYRAFWDWVKVFQREVQMLEQGPDYEAKVKVVV